MCPLQRMQLQISERFHCWLYISSTLCFFCVLRDPCLLINWDCNCSVFMRWALIRIHFLCGTIESLLRFTRAKLNRIRMHLKVGSVLYFFRHNMYQQYFEIIILMYFISHLTRTLFEKGWRMVIVGMLASWNRQRKEAMAYPNKSNRTTHKLRVSQVGFEWVFFVYVDAVASMPNSWIFHN